MNTNIAHQKSWFNNFFGTMTGTVTYFVSVMVKDHVTVTDPKSVTVTVTSTSDKVDDSGDIENRLSVLHCTVQPCTAHYKTV